MDNMLFDNGVFSDPKINVTFCLVGKEADLSDISKCLNLVPSRTRTPDDWPEAIKNPKTKLPDYLQPRYSWVFDMKYEICNAVRLQFEKMHAILNGKVEIINKLKEKYTLEASFEIGIHAQHDQCNMPEVFLTHEIIAFAASIGADIGFDMYLD